MSGEVLGLLKIFSFLVIEAALGYMCACFGATLSLWHGWASIVKFLRCPDVYTIARNGPGSQASGDPSAP
jgi:hypothetical protein